MKVVFRFGTKFIITIVIIFSVANTLFDLYTVVFYKTGAESLSVVVSGSGSGSGNGIGPGSESYMQLKGTPEENSVNIQSQNPRESEFQQSTVNHQNSHLNDVEYLTLTSSSTNSPNTFMSEDGEKYDNFKTIQKHNDKYEENSDKSINNNNKNIDNTSAVHNSIDNNNLDTNDNLYLSPTVKQTKYNYKTSPSSFSNFKSTTRFSSDNSDNSQNEDEEFIEKLHREYWKLNNTNISSSSATPSTKFDREFLEAFHNKSLWAPDTKPYQFGFDKNYDDRILLQKMWQLKADRFHPDLFENNKTKTIRLRDSFRWWNYKGGESLSCPGIFDGRCKMLDGRQGKHADAVIAVQDSFHLRSPLVSRDVFRIFFVLESPYASPEVNLQRENDLLAAYWRGSDLYAPYSKWVYYHPKIRRKTQSVNYASGKSEMAAIFVSNCESQNDRLGYIGELKRHMDVHVYGQCGDKTCSRRDRDSCFSKLKKDYRFYLAFENSNCRDYITEKFFINALQNDLIPVVLGAHPVDYAAIAPENSYIHVEDFSGPAELAKYLKELAENEDAYNKYFEWKGTGEFISTDLFCRVCSLLFYADEHPPRGSVSSRRKSPFVWAIHSQFNEPMCLKRRQWYWNRSRYDSDPDS